MKKINIIILALTTLILMNCKKNELPVTTKEQKLSPEMVKKLKSELDKLPLIIRVKDSINNCFVDFNVKTQSISISKNWSFSNPNPNTIYASSQGLVVYISAPNNSYGYGSGPSTITAGNTTLHVQTQCLALDLSAFSSVSGAMPINGFSMVIGLDADFSLLQNANNLCFSDFFKGLAYYMVYDSPASGTYNVIDWNNPNFNINNFDGYAYVFSFENCNDGKFYFSKSGSIDVNNGDMTFQNGHYWELTGLFNSIVTGANLVDYPGSGTMGCN
jgi:hypothetical protein